MLSSYTTRYKHHVTMPLISFKTKTLPKETMSLTFDVAKQKKYIYLPLLFSSFSYSRNVHTVMLAGSEIGRLIDEINT